MVNLYRAALAALAMLSAAPAAADAMQDRLLAGARAATELPFTRTSRSEQRSVGTPEAHVRIERYDPARPDGQRWTLVSTDGKPPAAKDLAEYATFVAKAPVPGYARLARWIGARATGDGRVYRYPALPKGIMLINGKDLSADSNAELHVDANQATAFVGRVRMVSTKGFRMMLVAKVDRVEVNQAFRLEGGKPVLAESITELTGSMMGKTGSMKTVATYSYAPPSR